MAEVRTLPGCEMATTPQESDADIERIFTQLREVIDRDGLDSLAVIYTTKQRHIEAKYTGKFSDLITSLAKANYQLMDEFCS